jgi:membrane protease subunit HflK
MRYLLAAAAFAAIVFTIATSLTQVQSHQRGVVRRFGRILDFKPEQGLYIGLPWGIDRVDLVDMRDRTISVGFTDKAQESDDIPPGEMLTGDHNLVVVRASINFRVREAEAEKFVLQAGNVDGFVARAAESLLAEWIAGRTVNDVLRRGKIELPAFLHENLQDRLKDYDLGIDIGTASITELDPPRQVKPAFERVGTAQNEIETKISAAEQQANEKRSVAATKTYEMRRQAQAYANVELVKARADAHSFRTRLAQYQELSRTNPDYLNTLWQEEMKAVYAKMRDEGRVELLDNFLSEGGLNITQFPLQPKKK